MIGQCEGSSGFEVQIQVGLSPLADMMRSVKGWNISQCRTDLDDKMQIEGGGSKGSKKKKGLQYMYDAQLVAHPRGRKIPRWDIHLIRDQDSNIFQCQCCARLAAAPLHLTDALDGQVPCGCAV